VLDYGKVLHDLVEKNIPSDLAAIPNVPVLLSENFKVVQINKHLTDNVDTKQILVKHNTQVKLKSEMAQINEAIASKQKELTMTKFASVGVKKTFDNELNQLILKKNSKSSLLQSTVSEILTLSSGV